MNIPASIEYRKVRNIRLEYGMDGLKVIVPVKYTGNVQEVIDKHSTWIARRRQHVAKLQEQVTEIKIEQRTDQLLRILIRELLEDSIAAIGLQPQTVKYRNMKSRWGSCSSQGVITFSTRMKHLPTKLISFVVHHETAHLKVMRHDKIFWGMMEEKFPNYRELKKELQLYGMILG